VWACTNLGKVVEAGDGIDALEKLKQQPIHLILTDINMPNMDGIQLLTELKSKTEYKDIPVIMITTEGGEAKVLEAVQLGANGYVKKPFTSEHIHEKLVGLF
jgi:two-component system, chemotaxis family, chemotaxis protein CheY